MKKEYETALSQLPLEKASKISKHKAVLGAPGEGFFSCFSVTEGVVLLDHSCK